MLGVSNDEEVIRVWHLVLQIVGPITAFTGLARTALRHAGLWSVVLIVLANGVRLLRERRRALIAIYWLGARRIGFFVAVAIGIFAHSQQWPEHHAG